MVLFVPSLGGILFILFLVPRIEQHEMIPGKSLLELVLNELKLGMTGASIGTKKNHLHAEPPRSTSVSFANSDDNSLNNRMQIIHDEIEKLGGKEEWEESIQCLLHLNSIEEGGLQTDCDSIASVSLTTAAERSLADAFGWTAWAMASEKMRKFHRPKVPDAAKIKEALSWLSEQPLALCPKEIHKSILKSPKTYLDEPFKSYRKAMETAPRKYRDSLVELIRLDPTVLEVTYNCEGEGCASECGRCWVSYQNRAPVISTEGS